MNKATIDHTEALAIATIAGAIYQARSAQLRTYPAGARGEIPPEHVDADEIAQEALDVWSAVRTAVREHNALVTTREDEPLRRHNQHVRDAGSCFTAGGGASNGVPRSHVEPEHPWPRR